MVVTVICDVLGHENNGTTIAAMTLIRSLRSKGHKVYIVCADKDKIGEPDCYVMPTRNLWPFNGYVSKNGVSLARPDKELMYKAIKASDVVHVMMPFSLGRAAAKIARKLNKPLTAGFHCQAENFTNHLSMMNFRLANKIAYHAFYSGLYKYCDCIHYPSQFICDTFENEVGKTNHYVISNGVNKIFKRMEVEKTGELKDKFIILFTGRYSKEKSHKILIDGVSYSKYKDNIQLIFAGAGPLENKLRSYAAKKITVQPIMKFFSREELVRTVNMADLYVHPAEIEIEAISCLEAIACGKVPVISNSKRSATRYFALSDNNLFECNNSKDLAKKIDFWYEHPEEREKCGDEYYGYADKFAQERCMDDMEQMLKDAIGVCHEK
jgi:1,2-diacylglycerol 3-alpha-glucosyltransferase